MSLSLKLLEDLSDETDIALDFIEREIGANNFIDNWQATKRKGDVTAQVATWMQKIGAEGDPAQIVGVIDELANTATRWLTPFTSPVPPEDFVLPSLSPRASGKGPSNQVQSGSPDNEPTGVPSQEVPASG